jgi:hypothetical protein
MERLVHQLAGLTDRLPSYVDATARQDEGTSGHLEILRARFTEEAEELNSRMLSMIEGRLNPAMRERARRLQKLLGHLIAMEASLVSFVEQLKTEEGREASGLPDRFAQSLQFLLLTTVDAFRSQAAEDLTLLHSLTEDRGETMNAIRTGYFESQPHLSSEARIWLFGLTNAFTRNVYLINQLAIELQHWVSGD